MKRVKRKNAAMVNLQWQQAVFVSRHDLFAIKMD